MRSLTLTLALAGLPAVLAAQAPVRNAPVRLEEPRRDRVEGRRDLRDDRREMRDDRRDAADDRRDARDDRADDAPRSTGAPILRKRKP